MDTKQLIEWLSSISLGTFIAWIIAVGVLLTAICAGTIKLYKLFTKYREAKEKNEKYEKLAEENKNDISDLSKKLDKIFSIVDEQKKLNYKQTRDSLVQACDIALSEGTISASRYRSLMEMYDEYNEVFKDMHPNGYVKKLVERVCDPTQVKIIGTLDDI